MKAILIDETKYGVPLGEIGWSQSHVDVTLNKVYTILSYNDYCYQLEDDNGKNCYIEKDRFMPLAKWREQQIDEILNL